MNGVWQEEAKLVPADGASYNFFGFDISISGDTAIIGSPNGDDMGTRCGSLYVFVTRESGTNEELKKFTPADGEVVDWFVHSVAIYCDTGII